MADQRIYHAPGLDIEKLGESLSQWLRGQGFETQVLPASGGGLTVQARKADTVRTITGTSAALNVTLSLQGDNLLVQTGAASWTDKAVVGAVGLLVFWPALIPAAYGAWKQKQLPQEIFQFIDQYIALGGKVPVAPTTFSPPTPPQPPVSKVEVRCPSCNAVVREGAKFCD
ncbi:MAG: zinc ribbon domain-containing protein, partial [Abditibacteriales bacterium]|nr:zinc ribbon domain-containing protein [Abditibacteriales bacterium]MDW8367101.1 hypothetical protein [Abditibacteriales bacterium]